MYQRLQGDSPWGAIEDTTEIVSDIYVITAMDENGTWHEGIMARKSAVGKTISKKAAGMGQEHGEWLCYGEDTKDIPVYEALQHCMAVLKKNETAVRKHLEEIRRDGKLRLTGYFGECAPPMETPDGRADDMFRVRNGIYLTQGCGGLKFAVHEAVADNYMTPMAAGHGVRKGDYLFYGTGGSGTASCCVALNELKNVFKEAEALIVSVESLYATLYRDFGAYVSMYNLCVPEPERIPEENVPADLFLAVQVEAAGSAGKGKKDQDCF